MNRFIAKDYQRLAPNYEERWSRFVLPARQWLSENLNHPYDSAPHVLDLGCGTGVCLELVSKQYPEAYLSGFDLSENMIQLAKTRLQQKRNVDLKCANLESVDFSQRSYDVIICFFMLHHIVRQKEFLKSMIQAAKPGGHIFICDYAVDSPAMFVGELYWRLCLSSHYKAYSSRQFKKILEDLDGVEIINQARFSPDWFWRQQIYQLKKVE